MFPTLSWFPSETTEYIKSGENIYRNGAFGVLRPV